ncbi:hypothetical protein AD953_02310, partial [Acetobacter malorum]
MLIYEEMVRKFLQLNHPVSNSRFSDDMTWPLRIDFDLLTYLPDIDTKLLYISCCTPQLTHDGLMGQDTPRITNQHA